MQGLNSFLFILVPLNFANILSFSSGNHSLHGIHTPILGNSSKRKRNQCSKIDPEEEIHNGYFHIWGSESYVVNAYLIGETSGQISTLYGVVEYEDGTVHRVPPECITFTE